MAPKGLQQSIENHLLINEEFNGCVTLSLVIEYASAKKSANGPLAQLVEQLTLNQRVAGSTPASSTKTSPHGEVFLFWYYGLVYNIIIIFP